MAKENSFETHHIVLKTKAEKEVKPGKETIGSPNDEDASSGVGITGGHTC